ncbi:unnamed protein product [Scytosiphon promiscuus]
MLLLASAAAVVLAGTCRAAPPPSATSGVSQLQLAFVPPSASGNRRFRWRTTGVEGASAYTRLSAAGASGVAVRATKSTDADGSDGGGGVAPASIPVVADGRRTRKGGTDRASRKGADEGARGKRDVKSLQERLNDVRFDFSLDGRDPYVAGAPRRIPEDSEPAQSGESSSAAAVVVADGRPRANSGRQALYANYRRRRRPLNALCMPKNQRPQGCAVLLPPMGTAARRVTVVDHVAPELQKISDLSEFKSDLPCVTSGTCPVPAFRCSKGHVWESNGSPVCFYCPVCADTRITTRMKRKRDLEAMQEIARGKGGECIAEEYLGMDEKISFRCGDGHEWLTSPSNLVYKNTWCPKCAALRSTERKKLTITDMHQTARQFGGVFLSPEYHGAAVKHEWRCKRGHIFWNTPNNVRRAEGGRRVATFCKICTMMDRNILRAAVLGGLSKKDAKGKLQELTAAGAMPARRHFLKKRATGKSTLATKRRDMLRKRSIKISGGSTSSTSDGPTTPR